MNDIINDIPTNWRPYVFLLIAISPYVTRAIHSLMNGGGLKGIFSSIWLGTNVPKEVSQAIPPPARVSAGDSLGLLFIIGLAAILFTGCTTNQQTLAYNSIYSVEKATTAAYDGYIDSILAGLTTTNAVPRVSRAYNTFQASSLLALDAVQFNTNAIAPPNLITESGDVINLINQVKGR